MNRRAFLGAVTVASVLAPRLGWAFDSNRIEQIGLQLYTVRGELKRDFEGTIAKVAAVGYREVEFAGYLDHTPQAVRAVLERNHLSAPAAHVEYKSLGEKWAKILEDSAIVGHRYLVCSWIDENARKNRDAWKRVVETFNKAGEASKKAGIQFAYHNHNFEFAPVEGKLGYDILLDETDPSLVKMEMDLCWITVAGQDPLQYFARYPGRFPLVHVKDVKHVRMAQEGTSAATLKRVGHDEVTAVGSGAIDWKRIFAHSGEAGIQHYFVEQDTSENPLESIKASYEYLEGLRF